MFHICGPSVDKDSDCVCVFGVYALLVVVTEVQTHFTVHNAPTTDRSAAGINVIALAKLRVRLLSLFFFGS